MYDTHYKIVIFFVCFWKQQKKKQLCTSKFQLRVYMQQMILKKEIHTLSFLWMEYTEEYNQYF